MEKRTIRDDNPSILAFDSIIDKHFKTNTEGDDGFFENPENGKNRCPS